MSTDPVVLAPVTVNSDLEKAIAEALSPDAVRAAVLAEAEKQTTAAATTAAQAAADKKAAEDRVAADAAHAAETKEFTRTETIGGREFEFTASTEIELERMVNNAFRVAYAVKGDEPAVTSAVVEDPAIAAAAAQKAAEERASAQVELELKFKRGEISAKDYIEQSGAMDEYLENKGIPVDALKAAVEQNQSTQFEQSWAQAAEDFKNSPAGADWPGGDKNKQLIGMQILALGLGDAPDKVAALTQAYASLKSTGVLYPYESEGTPAATTTASVTAAVVDPAVKAAADKVLADAAAAATERARVAALRPATSSSLFGQSSGVSGAPPEKKADAGATVEIPQNATPQEIMDAWKKAQVAAGKDPNAAFLETFQARRV